MAGKVFKHDVVNIKSENGKLVGVLFHFDTVSKNNTSVRKDAKVKVTSDAILRQHVYPEIYNFFNNLAGRILRFYRSDDDSAMLVDFILFSEEEKQKVLKNELAFSVAWIADSYTITNDNTLVFDDVTIYETSLVSDAAFDTCAAVDLGRLSCLNSACGCGRKNSVDENKDDKKDYIIAMEQELMQAIAELREQIMSLSERVAAIEAKIDSTPEQAGGETEIEELEAKVAEHSAMYGKLNKQFDELLAAVSDFVEKSSKAIRYV